MKHLTCFCLALMLSVLFSTHIPMAFAGEAYIDPVNGDNRNPGVSPATARKDAAAVIDSVFIAGSSQGKEASTSVKVQSILPQRFPSWPWHRPSMIRIILGSEIVTGWNAFTDTIWQAPLQVNANMSLQDIAVDGAFFTPGCEADFLSNGHYYWKSGTLYLNNATGNPDELGQQVTAHFYNFDTGEATTVAVTGWHPSPPDVWDAEFSSEPMHVFVDDALIDVTNWWWGPQYCEAETGKTDHLYLRDTEGNPDNKGKTVAAVVNSGGWAVASGDFNGDGQTDVVHSNSNKIFINYGASEFSPSPGQILTAPAGQAGFGFFVASAGDVNNDGFDDLIVSAEWNSGVVYLYMGSASGLSADPSQVIHAPNGLPAFGFGHGIAGDGNLNGDNYSDIVIMGGDESQAYVAVYLGSAEGIHSEPDSILQFDNNIYGGSVCIIGDTNGDGFDDVALSMMTDQTPINSIDIVIFNGTADGKLINPVTLPLAIPERDAAGNAQVAPAGDVNSDGFADLVVGNQWAQGDYENEGKAYIFLGSRSGLSQTPDYTIDNPKPEFNVRFGNSVTGISDMNGDGYDDIAVGCPYHQNDLGFVAIYYGHPWGMSKTPSQTISGVSQFGWSVAKADDPMGTGKPSLIAGEEFGGAYLYALHRHHRRIWGHRGFGR
jgi:hypothetical protein